MMPQKIKTSEDNMASEDNGNANKRVRDEDSPIKLNLEEIEDIQDNRNDPLEGEKDDVFIEKASNKEDEHIELDEDKGISIEFEDQINNEVNTQPENDKCVEKGTVKNKDTQGINHVWVSNVGHIKASELKKHFSQMGKVVTAKIMSNGKSFYGYVGMESAKIAEESMKQLNNSLLNDRKILVTRKRPDCKETHPKVEAATKFSNARLERKIRREKPKSENRNPESNSTEIQTCVDEKAAITIENLNRKLRDVSSDAARYKTKFKDSQRKNELLLRKIESLERQLENAQIDLRNERRKLNKEREEFEKKQKLNDIRIEADRAVLNKELSEVRKLRAHLKEKTEEFKSCSTNIAKRARSPVLRSLRSPVHFRMPDQGSKFRSEERLEKRSKREETGRSIAPPPAPKLNEPPKKRSSDVYPEGRDYFNQNDKKYMPSQSYEYRHKPSFASNPELSRNNFQVMYPKEMRRVNVFPSPSESYHVPRGGYQHQSNNVPLTPRNLHGQYYNNY